jgi:hypothetical protein
MGQPKRPGRPRKREGDKLTAKIDSRLTPAEAIALDDYCNRMNISRAEAVRMAVRIILSVAEIAKDTVGDWTITKEGEAERGKGNGLPQDLPPNY